jgi:uncharacterized membrane protein
MFLVKCLNLLLAALVAGTAFGVWLGFNPGPLSAGAYVEHQQLAIRSLNVVMPTLGAICIVLTVVNAVWGGGGGARRGLLLAAALCFVAAGIVTRFRNQPINREVMTWSAQSPPASWPTARDIWWQWHVVRTSAAVLGLTLLIVGTVAGVERDISWRMRQAGSADVGVSPLS